MALINNIKWEFRDRYIDSELNFNMIQEGQNKFKKIKLIFNFKEDSIDKIK